MIPFADVICAAARTLDLTDAKFHDLGVMLGSEQRIRELLGGAGFSDIQVRPTPVPEKKEFVKPSVLRSRRDLQVVQSCGQCACWAAPASGMLGRVRHKYWTV